MNDAVAAVRAPAGLLVACSGGADSVALAVAAVEARLPQVELIHVNHHLRGAESDGDEAFVVELGEKLGVPVRIVHAPITGDTAIEERARIARYDAMMNLRKCVLVATAHTLDDHAETVLHRLIRGTGLAGLAGIDDRPGIVRPFLTLRKAELEAFLVERNQPWRVDSSNADQRFTRNRLRHDVLPLLHELNPNVVEAVTNLAGQAREVRAVLDRLAGELLLRVERPRAGEAVVIDTAGLQSVEPIVVGELFRQLWRREGWPECAMTARHWRRLAAGEPGDYPGGVKVRRAGSMAVLSRH